MTTRSRRLLIALALIGGALAAGYAAAPALLASIVAHRLGEVVEVRELEIESIGLKQIVVSVARFNNKQMRFDAQQASIRYGLWPFRIEDIEISRALLRIERIPSGSGQGASLPVPPPFPFRVDALTLSAATPWGDISIPASIASGPGAAGGIGTEIQGKAFTLSLTNPARDHHKLAMRDADGAALLSLDVHTGNGFPIDFDGRIDPRATAQWARRSGLLPADLKTALTPYAVDGAGIDFSGRLRQDGGFTARLTGGVVVRDNRDASGRLFDLVEIQAGPDYVITYSDEAWSGSGDAAFEVSLGPTNAFTGRSPAWRWDGSALSFGAAEPELLHLGFGAESVDFTAPRLSATDASGELSIERVRTDWWPEALDNYDVDGRWSWRESSFRAEGGGTATALPVLNWTLHHEGDRGGLEVIGKQPVAGLEPSLRVYTRMLAEELNVTAGELDGRYEIEWDADRSQTSLAVTAGSVDADLDEMEIRGLDLRLSSRGDANEPLDVAVSAPILKLAAGAVAEDLEMKLRLSLPEIHIDAARLRLFDGDVAIRPVSINLDNDSFVFFADIDALSLDQIMALLELESTQLTGNVAGPVRVVYRKGLGIELNEGNLHNLQPGVLQFRLNPESEMTAQLDNIALRALEDFQYHELNASVLYQPDGRYRIAARIVGSNPKVLDGHPIALNPTIEGRLPALFRAFFITGDFSQAIIDRLRKEQSPSTPGETQAFE